MPGGGVDATGRPGPPEGEVTFLFTDLEGSTSLWEDDPVAMEAALAEHDARLRAVFTRHGGYVFTTAGDSFAVAFGSAGPALEAAVDAQRALLEPCGPLVLRSRTGLHTGTAAGRDGNYFGSAVNRCARLMSAGHGGQILVSGAARAAAEAAGARYPGLAFVDLGRHRFKDLRDAEHVFAVRHPDLPSSFPPLRTLQGSWNNLPTQLTDLVGRSKEIAEVHELLDRHRLVTLTGSGGCGKTRLALHVAAERADDHPDGLRLIELAPVSDPRLVADAVAEAVGARPSPSSPPGAAITARIGEQRMLLVLDNCEHLIDAVARLLAEVLPACAGLRVLATSQVPLDLPGEVRYRVPSLRVPDPDDATAAESEAVLFFTDRALAVWPDFALRGDDVGTVTAICRRLDGIPLAIELAAARVGPLTPAEILARLDERFGILGRSARGVTPRQQTLRGAMDWSHDLLAEGERILFRRLGVFAGTFDLRAVEIVCDGAPADRSALLDTLTALVDRALVVPEPGSGTTRYRLPETVRAYAGEQLGRAGELADVRARHADHFVDVAESLRARLRSGDMRGAIDGFDRDVENVRSALRSTLEVGHLLETGRLIAAVGHLWYLRGFFREGIEWCRELFDADPRLPDELLARTLHVHGTLLGSWEQPRAGAAILEREAAIWRRLGNRERLAAALNNLGNLLNDIGRYDDAEERLREAVEHYHLAGESAALALLSLGAGFLHRGRYEPAAAACAEAGDDAGARGDRYAAALAAATLAHCTLLAGGDVDAARTELLAARHAFVELGIAPASANCDMILGHLERDAGNRAAAADHLLGALDEPDAHWYLAAKYWVLQLVAGLVADPGVARRLLATARAHYDRVEEPQPAWVLDDLDRAWHRLGAAPGGGHADLLATLPEDDDAAVELARTELRRLAAVAGDVVELRAWRSGS